MRISDWSSDVCSSDLIHARIGKAAKTAGRDPAAVTLIAISKTFGAEDIRPLLEAGQRVFGENRVQEAAAKWPALRADFPGTELHLVEIGRASCRERGFPYL